MPIDRSFIKTSVDLSDMRCAIDWSVTFSSMRMTFLCALISCVETIPDGFLCGGAPNIRRGPAPPAPRIIERPCCGPPARTSRRAATPVEAPARGSYCTLRGMAPDGPPPIAVRGALTGVGIGTPGRPAQYSTPVFGADDRPTG